MTRNKRLAATQKIKVRCVRCDERVRGGAAEMTRFGAMCKPCARLARDTDEHISASYVSPPSQRKAPAGLPPRKKRDWERRNRGLL